MGKQFSVGPQIVDQVRDLCKEFNYTSRALANSGGCGDAFYEIHNASFFDPNFFSCLLSYSATLDRWGATHNCILDATDSDRLRFRTAREAVVWFQSTTRTRR